MREFDNSDYLDFFNLNSDPEVLKYTGDSPFLSLSDAQYFLSNYSDYRINGFGRWAVISKDSGNFLGWCGLKLNEEELIDLGFRFFQREWGKGYATESANATLNYGFSKLDLDEIIGRSSAANKASISVLEKIGMMFWKTGSCHGIENVSYYRIDKSQYKKLNS